MRLSRLATICLAAPALALGVAVVGPAAPVISSPLATAEAAPAATAKIAAARVALKKARARVGARRWAELSSSQRARIARTVIAQAGARRARVANARKGPIVPRGAFAAQPALEAATFAQINRVRRAHGLRPVRRSATLTRPARAHATWLATARNGNLTHNDAQGRPFHHRIITAGWGKNRRMSENLASINACRAQDPALMIKNWLASPGHRVNLLDAKVTHVGVAVVSSRNCGSTVYATDFGG